MGERGHRLGLPLEARQALRVRGEGRRQHLDGHIPTELGVVGAVDLSHPAGTERERIS